MTHHRPSPRPLSRALDALSGAWEPPSPLGRAQTAWDEVAKAWAAAVGEHGTYIFERTTPVSLRAGVLTVGCSEAVVAQTLALESERVLQRLNERLSGEPVKRLRCVTGGP